MKTLRRLWLVVLLAVAGAVWGQTANTTPSAPTSNINWLFAACDNRAVVDFNGTMQRGYDIYIQLYRETGARGSALSDLIRVPVDGNFQVSQVLNYPSGTVLGIGQFASLKISIARENDSTSSIFNTIQDDVYDTCIQPAFSTTATTVVGSGTGGTAVDPTTGQTVTASPGTVISRSNVLKPGGGYLNPVFAQPQEGLVQIGARPSLNQREAGRVSDVGLIFAECAQFPGADPGRLYDTDNLTIFWSWFAKTAAQVRDHQDKAQYEVLIEMLGAPGQPFRTVNVSPIARREDRNFWVFYTVNMGSGWQPGLYRVNYKVTWREPVFDGYENFGPGTENEVLTGHCIFNIEKNPYGVNVTHRLPVAP